MEAFAWLRLARELIGAVLQMVAVIFMSWPNQKGKGRTETPVNACRELGVNYSPAKVWH